MTRFSRISADSHIIEPADVWTKHIAPKFRDRAPTVKRRDGKDTFFIGDQALSTGPGMCRAGKPPGQASDTMEDVYPGAYDPRVRLKEQAKDGVLAEVIYPSVALRVFSIQDPALRQACMSADDDWIADFCRTDPERIKAVGLVDLLDIDAGIAELRRLRKIGLVGAMITLASDDPQLFWGTTKDRFWAEAQDLRMPISMHVVSQTTSIPDLNQVINETFINFEAQRSFANMIWGGLFERFPRLKVVSAENEAGWVGHFLDRMDHLYGRESRRMIHEYAIKNTGLLPSDYFRRNMAMTFIWDKSGVAVREWVGVDNLMWSNDYPHDDSSWPNSSKGVEYMFAGVPAADRRKIEAENAAKLYGFN